MASLSDVKGYKVVNGVPSILPAALLEIAEYNVRDAFNPEVVDGMPNADESLVRSMIANGFQSDKPVTVRIVGKQAFVIAGHRRFAAVREAIKRGAKISAIAILPEGKGATGAMRDNAEMALDLILSNSGEPLSPAEKGTVFARLRTYGWTDKEIAEKASVTEKWVRELCKLARLDARLRALIKAQVIAPTLALETVAKHGGKATEVVETAKRIAATKGKTKVTGKDISDASGKAGKAEEKAKRVAAAKKAAAGTPPVRPVATGTAPYDVLPGPFTVGKDMDDCTIFDAKGEVIAELATPEAAKCMLLLANQGWHVFHGKASAEPVATATAPTTPATPATPPAKPAPVRTTRGR